jgi:AcrR family transcriptional regulator
MTSWTIDARNVNVSTLARNVGKREAILAGAERRFARYGFRRTSMEDIAEEAGISRAGLYLEFPNKEEIFTSVARALHEQALAAVVQALEQDAPLAERVGAALLGKNLRYVELLQGSPHGQELVDEKDRLCGDLAVDAEKRFRDLVTRVFRRAAAAGEIDLTRVELSAAELAELFVRAASGLKPPGISADAYREGVAAFVRVFLAGLSRPARRSRS